MELVQVDRLDPEPGQARIALLADRLGRRAGSGDLSGLLVEEVAELGGDDYLVTPAGEGLSDDTLAVAGAVNVGGVEERDAGVERCVDCDGRAKLIS
jgi:hypothetical protein